ncbi:hypothetical protein [Anabaena catenula]|uniref:hypothetical protein n=1 Tax=Anabaena catenula TaxID=1296320 RepID=UPI001F558811|nr:hypothetical protein [Anabaena catenula]
MTNLLAGTEVQARNMRWEVVSTTQLGQQTLYRLRCLEGELRGSEFDILYPFESVEPVIRDLRPDRAAPLRKRKHCKQLGRHIAVNCGNWRLEVVQCG